jgi:hypothetical protein
MRHQGGLKANQYDQCNVFLQKYVTVNILGAHGLCREKPLSCSNIGLKHVPSCEAVRQGEPLHVYVSI